MLREGVEGVHVHVEGVHVLREGDEGVYVLREDCEELLCVVFYALYHQLKDVHGQLKPGRAGGGLPCIHPGS